MTKLYKDYIKELDIQVLREYMTAAKYKQARAARLLGISRGTLRKKLTECFGDEFISKRGDLL